MCDNSVMYHDDNVKIPVGLKKPVVFASFKSIYSYFANGGEVLDIFQKGATCCFPTSYRTGAIVGLEMEEFFIINLWFIVLCIIDLLVSMVIVERGFMD